MKTLRRTAITLVLVLTAPLMAAKCGDGKVELVGGEVVGDSVAYHAVDYQLTSDRYNQWRQAQQELDSANVDAHVRLDTRRLTEDDVNRAVEDLENNPAVRGAIERGGLSVRDYVLTTIALAQSWDAVNRPGARFSSVPRENIEFLRLRATEDEVVRTRPRARALDDRSDDDSDDSDDSDDKSDRRKEKPGKRGKDSDRDS